MWNNEWTRILKRSNEIAFQRRGLELDETRRHFTKWFSPVYYFLLHDIYPKYMIEEHFLSHASLHFVIECMTWLSHPIIKRSGLSDETPLCFAKKMMIIILFYNMFLYGLTEPNIFHMIGDDCGLLIVVAISWPIRLEDKFLCIDFPSLSVEKHLFLKTYIWYFLRMKYKEEFDSNKIEKIPKYILQPFEGIVFDAIPNDYPRLISELA